MHIRFFSWLGELWKTWEKWHRQYRYKFLPAVFVLLLWLNLGLSTEWHTQLFLVYILRQSLTLSLGCPGWAQTGDLAPSVLQSAKMTDVCHQVYLLRGLLDFEAGSQYVAQSGLDALMKGSSASALLKLEPGLPPWSACDFFKSFIF